MIMDNERAFCAEYIWLDGTEPTPLLRSKTRIFNHEIKNVEDIPEWGFDGSSTSQSGSATSDLPLKPVAFYNDPFRRGILVMCEVMNQEGSPHPSNHRARLRTVLEAGADQAEPQFGFEQEYTLFEGHIPFGWPKGGSHLMPKQQGPYYCGVGGDRVLGRAIAEEHLRVCLEAGLSIYGINAEVMPAQWEFQIGPRPTFDRETLPCIDAADQLWVARWLLHRVCEPTGLIASFHPKPVIEGDWNGAGLHTNVSTVDSRKKETGRQAIAHYRELLSSKHTEHIAEYGDGLGYRLTGLHETAPITQFSSGETNRGASIREPLNVVQAGSGYFEDRRPGANADPYRVEARILATICEIQLH